MKWGKGQQAMVPTAEDVAIEKARAEDELVAWRGRRERIASTLAVEREQLAAGRERQAAAVAVLDAPNEKELAGTRREVAAARVRVDELEAGLEAAARKIAELTAASERATRRVQLAVALEQLQQLGQLAAAVDQAWGPLRDVLEELVHCQHDVAQLLARAHPGGQYDLSAGALARVLFWRLEGVLDVPRPDAAERVSVEAYFSARYLQLREVLERELLG